MADLVHARPTDWMPKPPPPDWTVESDERQHDLAQQAAAMLHDWQSVGEKEPPNPWQVDTACRTRVAPRVARGTAGLERRAAAPPRVAPGGLAHDVPVAVGPATATRAARHGPRVALGVYVALLTLCCLGLAFWQLYFMLEATGTGRVMLDDMAAALTYVTGLL